MTPEDGRVVDTVAGNETSGFYSGSLKAEQAFILEGKIAVKFSRKKAKYGNRNKDYISIFASRGVELTLERDRLQDPNAVERIGPNGIFIEFRMPTANQGTVVLRTDAYSLLIDAGNIDGSKVLGFSVSPAPKSSNLILLQGVSPDDIARALQGFSTSSIGNS